MSELAEEVDRIAAETAFSGVVRVDLAGELAFARAYGYAHRGWRIANTMDTRFASASVTKGFTALVIVRLIEQGRFDLSTAARAYLGADLPLIGADVTIEHLLAHRSGIGDYADEEVDQPADEWPLRVPPQALTSIEAYLPALAGFPAKFPAGERFAYCNGGYVVLALIAERATGEPFAELVRKLVCAPAGLVDTGFPRSDELADRMALGYLDAEGLRTNVFSIPVLGGGDGGIYTTAADLHRLWRALFAGRIVSAGWAHELVRARSAVPSENRRYGLGFWLPESAETVLLEGFDVGVSARTGHDPGDRFTYTVLANTSAGAWPIARHLATAIG